MYIYIYRIEIDDNNSDNVHWLRAGVFGYDWELCARGVYAPRTIELNYICYVSGCIPRASIYTGKYHFHICIQLYIWYIMKLWMHRTLQMRFKIDRFVRSRQRWLICTCNSFWGTCACALINYNPRLRLCQMMETYLISQCTCRCICSIVNVTHYLKILYCIYLPKWFNSAIAAAVTVL